MDPTVQTSHPVDEYVDDRTLEARTRISRRQWQRWRQEGDGPSCRVLGRRMVRYLWGDVLAWLAAQPGNRPLQSSPKKTNKKSKKSKKSKNGRAR